MAQGRLTRGHVLLKSQGKRGRPNLNLALSVPQHLVDEYGLEAGIEFTCHITDEGIVYRPVAPVERKERPQPAWMK
ncbi:MAG TPA: hypothetical protein VLA89_08855 [Gemmatimonadales bacterium]|nr:hypothetical protein [Gemmatimonadales bacterium]